MLKEKPSKKNFAKKKQRWSIYRSSRSQIFHNIGVLKRDLRSKLHPYFHDIFLLSFWRKRLVQLFVLFWSVITKLVVKYWIRPKWRYIREYRKHFFTDFFCIFLLIIWRKNFLQRFMVFLIIFHELMNVLSFEWLNCLKVRDVWWCKKVLSVTVTDKVWVVAWIIIWMFESI